MFDRALVLFATLAVFLVAASAAMAGSLEVVAGRRAVIDVGDRDNYTTLTIRNLGTNPGRLEFAEDASSIFRLAQAQKSVSVWAVAAAAVTI